MSILEIRIYSEVLEQGYDIKGYIEKIDKDIKTKVVYSKKVKGPWEKEDSLVERIRKTKDVDILITAITETNEHPILMIEYSTSVPTDDHKMQRSDVYYWGSALKVPTLKIYATTKGMDQDFGGGDKITEQVETQVALLNDSVIYFLPWEVDPVTGLLEVDKEKFSCIKTSEELKMFLAETINTFKKSKNQTEYYFKLLENLKEKNKQKKIDKKKLISESTRFSWDKSNNLTVKINRFGHAMDPDRGILFFTNMLVGGKNLFTEIQVNRDSTATRGGYKPLFDEISKEKLLTDYVNDIIENNNNEFTHVNAVYVFLNALNLENILTFTKNSSDNDYYIRDEDLLKFLNESGSMTAKSIFLLTSKLKLTDKDRNVITEISWNYDVSKKYLKTLENLNKNITPIKMINYRDAKEDIVTYSSVQLFKQINAELVSVSYPGAQGDRALLFAGSGRKVKRIYIDIIAYQEANDKVYVYLQENKATMNNLRGDIYKLNEIKNEVDKLEGLLNLLTKNGVNKHDELYVGVGAKSELKNQINPEEYLNVDYIFMFDLKSDESNTNVMWQVAIIDVSLADRFAPLVNENGKLRGVLKLEPIYVIQ